MAKPRTSAADDVAALRAELAEVRREMVAQRQVVDVAVAEVAALRLMLVRHGHAVPEPMLDASYISVSRFAELHCLSSEAVLSRIRRKKLAAVKRGARWFVRCDLHGCTG